MAHANEAPDAVWIPDFSGMTGLLRSYACNTSAPAAASSSQAFTVIASML